MRVARVAFAFAPDAVETALETLLNEVAAVRRMKGVARSFPSQILPSRAVWACFTNGRRSTTSPPIWPRRGLRPSTRSCGQ